MREEILGKIAILRTRLADLSADTPERLNELEKRLEDLEIKQGLTANPLIRQLKENLQKKVEAINNQLEIQKVRGEKEIIEREVLFAKRDWYEQELATFGDADEEFGKISKQVDGWLKNLSKK